MVPTTSTQARRGLAWLVTELDTHTNPLNQSTVQSLLTQANLTAEEVSPYIEHNPISYARRCVARRENYELLVLTWSPSQGSVAHDHSGSLCGLKVVQGSLTEQLFDQGPDGQVRKTTFTKLSAGQITVDPGVVIHSLANDSTATQTLVTVHIYSPPLPEVRRYAVAEKPPAALFLRPPHPQARTIAIIGGGFTGTMTLANLLRLGNQSNIPLHIILIDRQPAIGDGIAYRTNDPRHLLNVPAARMSAWPDLPNDFLTFAQSIDPSINPGDFLPRKIYGQYIRKTLLNLAESAPDHLSVEVLRDEATNLSQKTSATWTIQTTAGRTIHADLTVLTIGHRPPNDPFGKRWSGPRHRFVADPWAALVLSQIGPDEPVLLLGSGLTAVDAILTLGRSTRTAPLFVISRRGLMPQPHAPQPKPPADLSQLLAHWLNPSTPLTIRNLVRTLRQEIKTAAQSGTDWQQIFDALRPAVPQLWDRLTLPERARFLTHVRPLWEIHRHRMAPAVANTINNLRQQKILQLSAASLISATADADGVDITLSTRGTTNTKTVRVSWVINCTGPGIQNRHSTHPILRPLLESGALTDDELSLGLRTTPTGHALDTANHPHPTLLIAGTLRKSTLWESTAVPELRQQSHSAAQSALTTLQKNAPSK
jgi:uncharacterized NAD(P)/FAD-binding protein YdhS/predicted metal-dependent enzyme (double-stranded beta helix superfamily)